MSRQAIHDAILDAVQALGGRLVTPEGPAGSKAIVEVSGRQFEISWSTGGRKRPGVHVETALKGGGDAGDGYREAATIVDPPRVVLRREDDGDRLGKRLGLNHELQTGDAEFDESVYVESELPRDQLASLLQRPAMREAIQTIVAHTYRVHVGLFDADGTTLTVGFSVDALGQVELEPLRRLFDAMACVADGVPRVVRSGRPRPRDKHMAALLVYFAAALVGLVFWIAADGSARHLTSGRNVAGVLAGVAAWLLAIPLLVRFSRGRSTALREVGTAAMLLGLALPCWTTGALTLANAAGLDGSPDRHPVEVLQKSGTSGKNAKYRLRVRSYRPGDSELTISLNHGEFSQLPGSGTVVLVTREGRLGWPLLLWIETPS